MYRFLRVSVVGLLVATPACYHATIDTGLVPSATAVDPFVRLRPRAAEHAGDAGAV